MSHTDIISLFEEFKNLKVAIIGDVMLDTYWWGTTDRISPEAPVPVVALQKLEHRVGGAANVALNAASLGATTSIISVIGDDADGRNLCALLASHGINTSLILTSPDRITTNKTRVMSRNQQMMRLDAEITTDINASEESHLLHKIKEQFEAEKPDVLIFEDYNKGVLTATCIKAVIALCKEYGVVTTVDPKKKNFLAFEGVDIFKPNLKEVKEGLNLSLEQVDLNQMQMVHHALQKHLHHSISLITLSEKGVFYQVDNEAKIIPTHVRNIADVSGAGDTVIAVASMVFAITKNMHLAAEMANIAGGLVCEEVGTAAINLDLLLKESQTILG
ncbi:MAG: carbohydrate kinase [Chitinophagaceae bacterium BSSC1]|nr:MAG: carbohydrate kinase [Chitinophagaceae bacterium BSSC1]